MKKAWLVSGGPKTVEIDRIYLDGSVIPIPYDIGRLSPGESITFTMEDGDVYVTHAESSGRPI